MKKGLPPPLRRLCACWGQAGLSGHRVRPSVSRGWEYPGTSEKIRRIAFRVHAGGSARGHLKKIRRAAVRAHAGGRCDAAKLAGDPKKVSHAGGRRTPLPRGVYRAGAVRLLMHTPPVSLSAASGQDRRNRFFSEREYAVYCVKDAPDCFPHYAVSCVFPASRRSFVPPCSCSCCSGFPVSRRSFGYACGRVKPEAGGRTEKAAIRSKVRNSHGAGLPQQPARGLRSNVCNGYAVYCTLYLTHYTAYVEKRGDESKTITHSTA